MSEMTAERMKKIGGALKLVKPDQYSNVVRDMTDLHAAVLELVGLLELAYGEPKHCDCKGCMPVTDALKRYEEIE